MKQPFFAISVVNLPFQDKPFFHHFLSAVDGKETLLF